MYKIIELGQTVPETGESRARLIKQSSLEKTASEIQDYWDKLEHSEKCAYLWVIGVSAMEYYGCNNNGDAFHESDLKSTIPDWAKNAHIFLHHVNRDPAGAVGRPVFAWYNSDMHRVELVLALDKSVPSANGVIQRLGAGEQLYVSMGCKVAFDVCSICGKESKTRADYCDHLRFNMKKILPDGRQVYAVNPNPRFFDISLVNRPADPTAFALDKLASESDISFSGKSSAQLGEELEDFETKIAAVRKVADIIKKVDGEVVDTKLPESVDAVRDISEHGFKDMDYPELDYNGLDNLGVSPAGLMRVLLHLGSPASLGDAYWMSGIKNFGMHPAEAFSCIPELPNAFREEPELFDEALHSVFSRYNGELEDPLRCRLIIKIVRPVAEKRIHIIRVIGGEDGLRKVAGEFGRPDLEPVDYGESMYNSLKHNFSNSGTDFKQVKFNDAYGHEVATTPYNLRNSSGHDVALLKNALGTMLALGAVTGAIAAPGVLNKVLSASVLGIPAIGLLSSSREPKMVSYNTGVEVPADTLMGAWKKDLTTKTASLGPLRWGTIAGMSLPGALALDYAYNKYRNDGYPPVGQSTAGKVVNAIGSFAYEHPVVATTSGALLGALVPGWKWNRMSGIRNGLLKTIK